MHCRLSVLVEESTITALHFPFSKFRVDLKNFEDLAKTLFNDTMVNSLILLVLRSKSHYIRCASENHSATRRSHGSYTRKLEADYRKAIQCQVNV